MSNPIESSSAQAKLSESSSENRISSPASTGGAGTFFEQNVGAYWLAQLLVGGIPPILIDCSVVEVHFQTEHLGWRTDDFLIVGQSGSGKLRKLAGQVKRTFTVSAIDEDCKDTVQEFWRDFKSPDRFSPGSDRFAIVTQRGTNTLLEHFGGLLDCSRAANDAGDFEHRLATAGFLSAKAVRYCEDLRTIIGELEQGTVSAAELWPFLRVLHVLSLDLATATRQTEVMIKSLLAHTRTDPEPIDTATNSWNALLAVVGDAMPSARTFRRHSLPESLRQRHASGATEQRMLTALKDHSAIILGGIRSTVGSGPHLPRASLVQQVLGKLDESQVVLLSGPAGTGKSAIAKDVVGVLSNDYFAFCFRAEEFAYPHFDATLHNAQIPGRAVTLDAVLASQDRKVLLIESVERLLEKSTRDAFTDLLTLAANERTLRIILTCRDYSTDLVRSCFLQSASIGHSVIEIPALNNDELVEIEAVHPSLSIPLKNPALRHVLRNPYVLDKALRIQWSDDRSLPESERDFRALFWQDIVRADHRVADGMPMRRELAFLELALRRARALSVYVNCTDLDPAVITELRTDSLVIASERNDKLVAPGHDVLEDWAILRWIEEQHASCGDSFRDLCVAIGPHPALRRGYRKWVSELIEYDPASADRLYQGAVTDVSVPANFRDDTLVSLLRARSSPEFLERHRAELLSNGNELLRRVIHLLRVACVTTPAWLEGKVALFSVPDGPAWAAVLRLVHSNLHQFGREDSLLLLGLIEDWGSGVSAWGPYPEGAEFAAAIAYSLLPGFDNYASDDELKRTLQVIAKIPNGNRNQFELLLRGGNHNGDQRNRVSEKLQEIIFAGIEGMPAARDVPDLLTSVLRTILLCSESDLQQDGYGSRLELETLFGLKEGVDRDYFPASAYRTPLLPLLRQHPRIALDFLISIFNHSADWYAHPRVEDGVEPPFEIELKFGDGSTRTQWCNWRLWNWYRGTSVGPSVLLSYLMALERWLFELAKAQPTRLDSVLLNILQRSESAALTAVAASVATAFPFQAGETLLTILGSPMCILLDRQRFAGESHASSNVLGLMPRIRAENRIYEEERKDADSLPHRKSDLETAIANLQLGPLAARVHEILDEHRKALPPLSEQDNEDRVWRLSMHRMDLRQYSVSEKTGDSALSEEDTENSLGSEQKYVRLELNDPEPDVKKMVDENAPRFELMQTRLGLLMWGLRVFKHEDTEHSDPNGWRRHLNEAQSALVTGSTEELMQMGAQGGPGVVAAVCVRDHWKEMSVNEQYWCVDLVCSEVMRDADNWNHTARAQRFGMSADRACAWVLPALIDKPMSEAALRRVQDAFVIALTHPTDEVRWYATWGIAEQLWFINRDLTLRCVNAIAIEANVISDLHHAEDAKAYPDRRPHEEIAAEAASIVRQRYWNVGSLANDGYAMLDVAEWCGAEANNRILTILGKAPTEPTAITAFTRAAGILVGYWDAHNDRDKPRPQRNYEAESGLSDRVQSFVMQVPFSVAEVVLQPILDAADHPGRDIHWFVLGLLGIEDREPNTNHFWSVWELFADRVKRANWIAHIDDRHSTGSELISAMFLGTRWKENVRHWRSLEGHAHHVHSLFESLPPSSTVLDDYVRFLYHVGEQSLPESFIRIAKRLKTGEGGQALSNTVFMLEVLLQRHVYARPLELKRRRELRDAVLYVLDQLVEIGSSACFRMRDDFVTPISVG